MRTPQTSQNRLSSTTKRRPGVVSAFVFGTPDLAFITRVRNLAEFCGQCVDDFWEKRTDVGFFVGCLRRCEYEMQSLKSEPKLSAMGEAQRYSLELDEEISSLLNLAAEAAVRQQTMNTQEHLKRHIRIRYLANALLGEARAAMNAEPV